MLILFYTLNLSEFNDFQATRVNLTNTTSIRANYDLIGSNSIYAINNFDVFSFVRSTMFSYSKVECIF